MMTCILTEKIKKLNGNEIKILEWVLAPKNRRETLSRNPALVQEVLRMYFSEKIKPKSISRRLKNKVGVRTLNNEIINKYPLYKEFVQVYKNRLKVLEDGLIWDCFTFFKKALYLIPNHCKFLRVIGITGSSPSVKTPVLQVLYRAVSIINLLTIFSNSFLKVWRSNLFLFWYLLYSYIFWRYKGIKMFIIISLLFL